MELSKFENLDITVKITIKHIEKGYNYGIINP